MKRYKFLSISTIAVVMILASCINDLDTVPLNKQIQTAASIYNDPNAYKEMLAKLYSSMTSTGQRGEYGKPEITANDEGTTSFMRTFWSVQEITTDECISAWGDAGITEFHGQNWSEQNGYILLLYQRIFINIAYCNEYIREVNPRIGGLNGEMKADVTRYVAEARFLRALFYYYAMDLWGNVPFVTDADPVAAFLPKQIKRADLFKYIEDELNEVIPALADAGANEYARADKAAAWTLLAKMYLNAKVYIDTDRYADCKANCAKVIGTGLYSLNNDYGDLFRADNDKLKNEIIMPIAEDGNNGRNYGGVTFIIHAEVGGSKEDATNEFGIGAGGWSGNRPTNAFVDKFSDKTGATDKRALFFTDGQTLDITEPLQFAQGYLVTKWRNVTSSGALGQNDNFVDTDFPLFRLADVYLMYAEAAVRTSTDLGTALSYVNSIRTRAYGDNTGNITADDLTLQFLLDERGRELYWEASRRTDLIRFNQFTGDAYLWDWKGNIKAGATTDSHYNLLCLPAIDMAVNTNLVQNPGY